jgi:hypothetical protein
MDALKGKKTYILAGLGIALALAGRAFGVLDNAGAAAILTPSILALPMRQGMKTEMVRGAQTVLDAVPASVALHVNDAVAQQIRPLAVAASNMAIAALADHVDASVEQKVAGIEVKATAIAQTAATIATEAMRRPPPTLVPT